MIRKTLQTVDGSACVEVDFLSDGNVCFRVSENTINFNHPVNKELFDSYGGARKLHHVVPVEGSEHYFTFCAFLEGHGLYQHTSWGWDWLLDAHGEKLDLKCRDLYIPVGRADGIATGRYDQGGIPLTEVMLSKAVDAWCKKNLGTVGGVAVPSLCGKPTAGSYWR